jgi:hypothetical protein
LGEQLGRPPDVGRLRLVGEALQDRLGVTADIVGATLVTSELGQLVVRQRNEEAAAGLPQLGGEPLELASASR